MPLYRAIVSEMLGSETDVSILVAAILRRVHENNITYCASKGQMFVYDSTRGFWTESVGDLESVAEGLHDLALYLDDSFQKNLQEDATLSPDEKQRVRARVWALRKDLLNNKPSVREILRHLQAMVSH